MDTLSKDGPNKIWIEYQEDKPQSFAAGWKFAELHMPAVRKVLGSLPADYFLDFATAPAKQDMQEATDLVIEVSGGTMAVRVRSNKFYRSARGEFYDWSVRCVSHGRKTEIHKLREGFGDWYFYGYSLDDKGKLAAWWLLDMHRVREEGILDMDNWQVHPNRDGTSGMYIPLRVLEERGCVIDFCHDIS